MITAEDRIAYAPIGKRPILKWPNGARAERVNDFATPERLNLVSVG